MANNTKKTAEPKEKPLKPVLIEATHDIYDFDNVRLTTSRTIAGKKYAFAVDYKRVLLNDAIREFTERARDYLGQIEENGVDVHIEQTKWEPRPRYMLTQEERDRDVEQAKTRAREFASQNMLMICTFWYGLALAATIIYFAFNH